MIDYVRYNSNKFIYLIWSWKSPWFCRKGYGERRDIFLFVLGRNWFHLIILISSSYVSIYDFIFSRLNSLQFQEIESVHLFISFTIYNKQNNQQNTIILTDFFLNENRHWKI